MSSHEYMTQQVLADRRDRLHADAELHRACRDAPDQSLRRSLVTRLAGLLARPHQTPLPAPTMRRASPAARPG
jgi:hypothetical protein